MGCNIIEHTNLLCKPSILDFFPQDTYKKVAYDNEKGMAPRMAADYIEDKAESCYLYTILDPFIFC